MILVDLNQTAIASLMVQINSDHRIKIEEDLVRHIILNNLRSYANQFKSKYGELVICCDSRHYWRREVFPFYKSHRKKDRDKSNFDWSLIFDVLGKIKEEIKDYMPYKFIEVPGAEADDVIAVLTAENYQNEEILILSSDKDFIQLQKYRGVSQYNPILKRFISTDNPQKFIKEHIIRGDRGDGIPNFLSADNVFAIEERQKSINSKKLTEWLNEDPDNFCSTNTMKHGYKRNQMLIDLDFIPDKIKEEITSTFSDIKQNTRNEMLNYLIEKRMTNLIEVAGDF